MNKLYVFILSLVLLASAPAMAQPVEDEGESTESSPAESAVAPKTEAPRINVRVFDSNPPSQEELAMRRKKIQEAYRRIAQQKARRLNLDKKRHEATNNPIVEPFAADE